MAYVDRDLVLERVDLAALATEICGEPHGRGPSAKWHCPNPQHPDAHPSMGIYRNAARQQRWKCHACGEGGTAVDLLMITTGLSAGEALRELARTVGLDTSDPAAPPPVRPPPTGPPRPPAGEERREPHPVLEHFVTQTAELLWSRLGAGARKYLRERGFGEELLRANRVGFDPGPRQLPRPDVLPRGGPGIVYPVLDPESGRAVYYQLRYLSQRMAARRKYDQPRSALAPNPRIASVRPAGTPAADLVAVCEGFPDALTAAGAGIRAVAVLGVAHVGPDSADQLAERVLAAGGPCGYVVCFDADQVAEQPALRLVDRIAQRGVPVARLVPPAPHKDLNDWWRADPAGLRRELLGTAALLNPRAPAPAAAEPELSPGCAPRDTDTSLTTEHLDRDSYHPEAPS